MSASPSQPVASAKNETGDSTEYQNFQNLLLRIVTVPKSEIQKRMDESKATKDWVKKNELPEKRHRPIVSPSAVSSSKIQP